MSFTIKGNKTPTHNKSLCDTCSQCFHIKGEKLNDEKQLCLYVPDSLEITCKVTECSGYSDKSKLDLYDLKKIAWIIETKGSGKSIGFVKPSERNEKQKEDIDNLRE